MIYVYYVFILTLMPNFEVITTVPKSGFAPAYSAKAFFERHWDTVGVEIFTDYIPRIAGVCSCTAQSDGDPDSCRHPDRYDPMREIGIPVDLGD
jgi:hypothetical protein